MGAVFRKTYTKPLPEGAEITTRKGERFARWKDRKGKGRTAPLTTGKNGETRILLTASTFTAKYRDGQGIVQEVSTGCRDETAAKRILADLERRAELVKSNVLTASEDAVSDHQHTPLAEHIAAYIAHQTARGLHPDRITNTNSRLNRIAADCQFSRLSHVAAMALERWLLDRQQEGMSAGARNGYREAWVGFGNWCVKTKRLLSNPVESVHKADAKADQRRKRRALTEEELSQLLYVAQHRPLAEYGRETIRKPDSEKKGRKTWKKAPLTPENIDAATERAKVSLKDNPQFLAEQDRIGRERALIYKTYLLTGLRRGELASLRVHHLELDAPLPFVTLDAANEKNRQGSEILLRADLVADLREWLAETLEVMRAEALRRGEQIPKHLPPDTPLFSVPDSLLRVLNRDLKAAGIPKKDDRGRTVDLHALRHTFGTHLSKGGVAPRVAQAAMRHSSIDLTMNVYTDPRLLDVATALEALPSLSLKSQPSQEQISRESTGTDGADSKSLAPDSRTLAPTLAPTTDRIGQSVSNVGKNQAVEPGRDPAETIAVSPYIDNKKESLTTPVNDSQKSRVQRPS